MQPVQIPTETRLHKQSHCLKVSDPNGDSY